MSAPHSMGRTRYGVATVLSTISGTPASWAIPATVSTSRTSLRGLGIISPKNATVVGRTASRHCWGSSGSATNVVSTPSRGSVCLSRLYEPP